MTNCVVLYLLVHKITIKFEGVKLKEITLNI